MKAWLITLLALVAFAVVCAISFPLSTYCVRLGF